MGQFQHAVNIRRTITYHSNQLSYLRARPRAREDDNDGEVFNNVVIHDKSYWSSDLMINSLQLCYTFNDQCICRKENCSFMFMNSTDTHTTAHK